MDQGDRTWRLGSGSSSGAARMADEEVYANGDDAGSVMRIGKARFWAVLPAGVLLIVQMANLRHLAHPLYCPES